MTTETHLSRPLRRLYASVHTVIFIALIAIAPVAANADQHDTNAANTRVADVSLADLDLSTSEGMRVARERLQAMAQRICAGRADNREVTSQPGFVVCVDKTVADALENISRIRQTNATVRNSVTRAANVSVADLDLSTMEGSRAARERLEAMARRLCAELARGNALWYRPNWAACVHDAIADAMAQARVIAEEKETRTAASGTLTSGK